MLNVLREKILFPRKSPGIIWLYQYIPGDMYDLLVLERADTNLWSMVVSGDMKLVELKAAIFQVFFTLSIIQKYIPSFRHNDLKIDNVLIKKSTPVGVFTIGGSSWCLPQCLTTKLNDFDFSCCDIITNPKVGTAFSKEFGCDSVTNHFYDVHIFLNSMYRCRKYIPKEIVEWIRTKVPRSLLGDETAKLKYGRLKYPEKCNLPTPIELIKDPFFDEFKM